MTNDSERFAGTMPVSDRLAFDEAALARYLESHIAGFWGPLTVRQFKGGQSNPSYRLDTPERSYVLRRKPPGKLLPSAHAVDREFRVISALADTPVPVPKTHVLCEDADVIGTAFYVMDYVDGRVLWDPTLPDMSPEDRKVLYGSMNATIAALHSVDFRKVGLADFGRVGSYLERQIGRWTKQYRASETETIEAMDNLIEWLPANLPDEGETTIVHGDFRLDNLIVHKTEPRVVAVLDWELSTLGDPLADFSYHCMAWRLGPDLFRGLAGIDFGGLNIPDEDVYVADYCRRTGRDGIENLDFYMAYNMFRLAAILQGIMGRVVDGTAASEHARELGARARPLAEAGWQQAQKVMRRT